MKPRQFQKQHSLISIVLPVYNESDGLQLLYDTLIEQLDDCDSQFEFIFINDGSTDSSAEILQKLAATDPRVKVIHFSRNFGHQPAIHAGLSNVAGDAVVLMDSDLQDDPSAIPEFIQQWRQGYDVVYATRTS